MGRLQEKNGDGMNYDDQMLATFDKYANGEMSPEEMAGFERSLKEDQEFREAFEDYRNLKEGIKTFGYNQFAAKLDEWENELSEEDHKVVPINRTWYMVAAAVAILIASVIGITQFSGQQGEAEIFANYYEPYPDILTDRGAAKKILNEGLYQYESRDYEAAITSLRAYVADHREQKEVYFYLAQAYLANGEAEKALDIFNSLVKEQDFKLREANDWYRALSYLKINNTKTAQNLLQLIKRDDNHAYRERSVKLLEELK